MRRKLIAVVALALLAAMMAACNLEGTSPTATFKEVYEATKRQDTEALRKMLSKDSLSSLEQRARRNNKTVDELLRDNKDVPERLPETRNEKINGDRATLEYKDEKQGKWQEVQFVREDGRWKAAL